MPNFASRIAGVARRWPDRPAIELVRTNGTDVDTLDAFRARLQDIYLRNPLKLRVDREGEPVMLTLPAAQMPSS